MCQLVSSEIAISPEHLPTLIALVGFVIGVSEKVGLEIGALVELSLADRTLMRRLLHVKDLVDGQCSRLAESLATLGANERFLLGVDVAMVSQVILASEGLPTDVTRVRSLVCVCPFMNEQVVGLGELSVAEFTFEFLLGSVVDPGSRRGFYHLLS